jgi:methyl-accepting chemotaxis protein
MTRDYRRRQYFVNRSIQLPIAKHGFVLLGAAAIFAAGFFHIVDNILQLYSEDVVVFSLGDFGANSFLFIYAICFVIVGCWLLFIMSVYFSHRVAGPVDKISSQIHTIADGGVATPLVLRNGDHLRKVSKAVNHLQAKIDAQSRETSSLASQIADRFLELEDQAGAALALNLVEALSKGPGEKPRPIRNS